MPDQSYAEQRASKPRPEPVPAIASKEPTMTTGTNPQPDPLQQLAKMQNKAVDRFELELGDLRTSMTAMAACCEESLARLRDARWVPYDAVSRLVTELTETVESERANSARLSSELQSAKRAVEEFRAECRAELASARAAALRYREEAAASFAQELNSARELAMAAMEAEARARQELTAMQARNQEIVDAQMLRLVELKRDLETASAQAENARTVAETANREAVAKLAQRVVTEPARHDANRADLTPEFAAIEAVLAGSPPVPAWERIA
jgi:DNA repair exonuclease SbcCD ATPase subunit